MQTISFAFYDSLVSSVVKKQLGHILAMIFFYYQKRIQSLNLQQMPTLLRELQFKTQGFTPTLSPIALK
jgi:hypothetical protein